MLVLPTLIWIDAASLGAKTIFAIVDLDLYFDCPARLTLALVQSNCHNFADQFHQWGHICPTLFRLFISKLIPHLVLSRVDVIIHTFSIDKIDNITVLISSLSNVILMTYYM